MTERPLGPLIERMSPWRIDCANRCMAQFFFRYVQRRKRDERQSVAAAYGTAFDEAGNHVYRGKLETGETTSADDAADMFAAQWDFISMVVDDWGSDKKGVLLDRGVAGAKLWRNNIAQFVKPLSKPQQKLEKVVADPRTGDEWLLMGYLDLHAEVRGVEVVSDMKAPGKRYSEGRLLQESQPTAYTILADVPRFEYHVVTNTPRPVTQVIGANISKDAQEAFLLRAGMLRRRIEHSYMSGDWLPNRQHQLCTRRYCDHWEACQNEFGGEVRP